MRLDTAPVRYPRVRSPCGEHLSAKQFNFRRRWAERDQLHPTFRAAMISYALHQPDMLHVHGYAYSEFTSLCYGFGYI